MSNTEGALEPPEGVIPNFEHPKDVIRTLNIVVQIVNMSLVTPFILLRIYFKSRILRSMQREDWVCIAAWIMFLSFCSNTLSMSYHGGGIHQWEVTKDELVGYDKAVYRGFLIYGITALLVKITLILIFARVFAIAPRTVVFIYCFMGAMTLYYVLALIIKIRLCNPIAGFWNHNIHASCINQYKFFVADTVLSIFTDLGVLIIPIPIVWMLTLPLGKKVKVFILLGAGGVATGTSIARMVLILNIGKSADTTISTLKLTLLATAEMAIGMVCTSLPALSTFCRRCIASRKARGPNPSDDIEMANAGERRKARKGNRLMEVTSEDMGSGQSGQTLVMHGSISMNESLRMAVTGSSAGEGMGAIIERDMVGGGGEGGEGRIGRDTRTMKSQR